MTNTTKVERVKYTKGDPMHMGVYACRVDSEIPGMMDDIFLMWVGGRWGYMRSDQYYRGKVRGWIGPLERWTGDLETP